MGSSRVELFEAIRRDARREDLGVRELARKYRVHRRTVRRALDSALPPPRKVPVRRAPRLDPLKPLIDGMLREDLTAPRKQRHTARRIHARLVDEHGQDDLKYPTVRDYVARRRAEIALEAGQLPEAFVPQTHEPGAEAECDFTELFIDLAGTRTRIFLFTLRLSYSGRAVHRGFTSQGQEAFLEGHLEAFARFGGVPWDKIRYDNLTPAVARVLGGREREESTRWVTFRSHYGFDAFYCEPGKRGAHEKGGVEHEGGRFRRNHLVPVPKVESLAQLNSRLEAADDADDARRIANRVHTVGHDFATEAPMLRPLPAERFEPGVMLTPRVDQHARIPVRQARYSVPARLIGRRVRALLRASELVVLHDRREVARHARATAKGAERLVLDHYLEVLERKPGALPGATALVQARASGAFASEHEAFWAAARKAHGDAGGTRQLIQVLLLHRHLDRDAVLAGLRAATSAGATSADVVAVEARRIADEQPRAAEAIAPAPAPQRVVSLTERRLADPDATVAALPPDRRPLPAVSAYDELLHRRTTTGSSAPPPATTSSASLEGGAS
ncbi:MULTISPECIES: IS21 family transposase [unclassified Pseudonocardia]|uniref:IS21 family transposase n=1 Tax=Pseudonocardia TaxID=1847 RepID=UPI00201674A3|nr:IS21 family transposase [Pseudonocardia sp. Ae707_Ps1]